MIKGRTVQRLELQSRHEAEKTEDPNIEVEREKLLLKRKRFSNHAFSRMTQMKGIADIVDGKEVVNGEENTQIERPRCPMIIGAKSQLQISEDFSSNDDNDEDDNFLDEEN